MWKLESYITPYILAYLDKYFKNFNPANFQVYLWSGGASFNNLDLNLEVLENEFNLPVTFVSGHIHELRLNVPWTKITYEPIIVNVNTIEITLKLKKGEDEGSTSGTTDAATKSDASSKAKGSREPEEPPGYVQNLINKMVTNVRIDCQNVIVKLVEEDIVFTLNVKDVKLSSTGSDWNSAFIDLVGPEFTLRRKLAFSDLTVCLDQTNSAGKIEQYLEPLLYKCSFEIRMLQKYAHAFAAKPYFTRMDLMTEELKFTITDEQIPMLLRLYNLILAVKNNIKASSSSTHVIEPISHHRQLSEDPEASFEEDDDPVMNWAGWAMSWVPDILGSEEPEESPEDANKHMKPTISHVGFYANKATIVFKGMEAVAEQKNSSGARRVKFQPFLKVSLQGMVCDMIQSAHDTNLFMGISQIVVMGVHTCPCGMKDILDDSSKDQAMRSSEYLNIGNVNRHYLMHTLFDDEGIVLPDENMFTYENHVELFTEEMMLNRTPAVAIEYLDVGDGANIPTKEGHVHHQQPTDGIDLARDKLLCRLVVGPSKTKICSGSIHRIKMLLFAATVYDYESFDVSTDRPGLETSSTNSGSITEEQSVDLSKIRNIESAYDIYQFTIFRPYIEILAGDHLDYDHQTHLRAKYKKRKTATITPLSEILPEWPKIIFTFSCIDGRATDPNSRFKRLMKKTNPKSSTFPHSVLELFTYKLTAKIFTAEVKLLSDKFVVPVCIPFNMEFNYNSVGMPDIWPSQFSQISKMEIQLEDFRLNIAKPHLMLFQVILVSCYDERMSEHLTSTTILRDLPNYNQGDVVIHITEFSFEAAFTRVLHAIKLRVGSVGIFIHSSHHPTPIPIFEGPPNNRPDPEGLAVVILQYPLHLLEEETNGELGGEELVDKNEQQSQSTANDMTPLLIVNISEFLVQFELIFFQWLSYHPKQMASSIPPSMQTSNQVLPMIPVSRASSRMSVMSKPQSSWSASDHDENPNNPNNKSSVASGKDLQQIYASPTMAAGTKPQSHIPSIPESSAASHSIPKDKIIRSISDSKNRKISSGNSNINETKKQPSNQSGKPKTKSTLEEEFQLSFAPQVYIDTWQKWVVSNLAVIMKSFIMINIGAGDIWFPVGHQLIKSFHESEENSSAHGVLVVTPKICALPEGPKTNSGLNNFSTLRLPVPLPTEYKGRELYPLRITLENITLITVHAVDGRQLFGQPLSILLTLTLSEKKAPIVEVNKQQQQQMSAIAAFLHSDIPSIKLSLSFLQVNLLLKLIEQCLFTTSILLDSSGSLMLSPIENNNLNFDLEHERDSSEYNPSSIPYRRRDSKAGVGNDAMLPSQHLDTSSLPETEPPNFAESIETESNIQHQHLGNLQVETVSQPSQPESKPVSVWVQVTLAQFQLIIMNSNSFHDKGHVDQLVFELEDVVSSFDVQSVFVKWTMKIANISLRSYERTLNDRWDVGKCVGIIVTSSDEITKDIKIHKSSNKREHSLSLSASVSGNSSPIHGHSSKSHHNHHHHHSHNKSSSSHVPAAPTTNATTTSANAGASSKMRGILNFTYTQVQTKNFHRKSELYNPIARWNTALRKYCDNKYKQLGKECPYDKYDNEDERYLSEFDLKLGSLDFLVDLEMLNPYMKLVNSVTSVKLPSAVNSNVAQAGGGGLESGARNNSEKQIVVGTAGVSFSQTNLPLIYLETGLLRLFFKSSLATANRVGIPDVLCLQLSALNVHSQSENPINRTVVSKDLYRLAESTSILNVPGAPIEDRQYTVDFVEISVFTCHWTDLKANSRELLPNPSSRILKTMGENPALEWNTVRSVSVPDEVLATPLLETINVGIGFAPCIVYEGNMNDTSRHIVVAGHSLEINTTNEVYIYSNLHQLSCICSIMTDVQDIIRDSLASNNEATSHEVSGLHNVADSSDSGIDSVVYSSSTTSFSTPVAGSRMTMMMMDNNSATAAVAAEEIAEKSSSVATKSTVSYSKTDRHRLLFSEQNKQHQPGEKAGLGLEYSSERTHNNTEDGGNSSSKIIIPNPTCDTSRKLDIPFDFLWTASFFQVMTYDIKYQHFKVDEKSKVKSKVVGIVPLTLVVLGQPHVVLSISESSQRAEVSVFELCVGFGPAVKKPITSFSLPDIHDFPERLFECTSGEKNPKTGISPAFFTFKILDFLTRPFDFTCDFGRPIKITMSRSLIKSSLRIQRYFETINWKRSNCAMDKNNEAFNPTFSTATSSSQPPPPPTTTPVLNDEDDDYLQSLFGRINQGRVTLNQVVLAIIEEAEEEDILPRSSAAFSIAYCDMKIRSRIKNLPSLTRSVDKRDKGMIIPDSVYFDFQLAGITLKSGIGARRDIIMTPSNMSMKGKLRFHNWKPWPSTCSYTASVTSDPISLHFGPQNVLAVLQLYKTFGNYLQDFVAYQEEKIQEIMQVSPDLTLIPSDEYEDDLRAGSFRYVYKDEATDLPAVYQIAFCQRHHTMTWRYPHKRVLTRVDSFPVPVDSSLESSPGNSSMTEVPCIVEYWDEAQEKFCHYGILYLSEFSRGSLRCPDKSKLHLYMSYIWRVVIEVPESDSINLVKPELLAASLRVDSLQDPSLNPMLKLYFDIPRISINFLNHMTYAGKTPDVNLKCFSFAGMTLPDQPCSTLELNTNTILISLWALKCKLDLNSYLKLNVTEYGYLTNVPVIEPFNFQVFWNLSQKSLEENKTSLKLQMSTKPIGIKLSPSVLHTCTASLISWIQVLGTYNGEIVDFTSFQSKRLVHLAEVLICNDLNGDILLSQVQQSNSSGQRRNSEFQCIGGRECFAFVWPTQKATSYCKVSVRDPDWRASDVISLNKIGYSVVKIFKSNQKLFVNVSKFSGCQKLVTISGSFSVVNALDDVIEVALLPKFGGREITWPIQSKSHGPSRLLDIENVEHLRFRLAGNENSTLPWSPVVSIEEVRGKRYIFLELYKEKEGGSILTYSVWCSYVEEIIDNTLRCIIIVSPFYRVRSSLPTSTIVYNTVGRNLPEEIFQLEGEGSEQQIEFIGSPDVVHHLTFQSRPNVSQSSPPIALLPGGPEMEKDRLNNHRPIDEIIQAVVESTPNFLHKVSKKDKSDTSRWPYISDSIVVENWNKCDQITTDIGMEYTTWIDGLPTVLVDIKPRSLIINLTGHPIYFCQVKQEDAKKEQPEFELPSTSVFTPPNTADPFKLGFEAEGNKYWTRALELTEQKSRTDIHYINSNSQIPLDCFSRLEIYGENEICHITLETRMNRNILTITLRSTFMVQNRTESWLLLKGISLSGDKVQDAADWQDIPTPQLFYPESKERQIRGRHSSTPLLLHFSDHSRNKRDPKKKGKATDDNEDFLKKSPLKYLALSCGGPWWFTQLLKFDLVFNHMSSASEGISGKRFVVALPKFSPASTTCAPLKSSSDLEDASFPCILTWCIKNGQVWISISTDKTPQLILHNLSSKPFFYAQANTSESKNHVPVHETENFEQYFYLPSHTRGYYTFPSSCSMFPKIFASIQLPSLLIARVPEKPKGLPKDAADAFNLFYEKNVIFNDEFEWSKAIRVDGPLQYVQIVDTLGVKVTIEHLGLCSHIYIENLSSVEVSAKDIRHRILGGPSADLQKLPEAIRRSSFLYNGMKNEIAEQEKQQQADELKDKSKANGFENSADQMVYSPMEFVIYVPWLRVIFFSSVDEQGRQHEILSTSVQDLILEKLTQVEHYRLRCLGNQEYENSVLRVCIGDVQVDTPPFSDKNPDFIVILKQDELYVPLFAKSKEDDAVAFNMFSETNQPFKRPQKSMILIEATFGPSHCNSSSSSLPGKELHKLYAKFEPISVFIEKHLLTEVIPLMRDVFITVEERISEFSNWSTLPAAEQFLMSAENTKSLPLMWNFENILDENLPHTSSRTVRFLTNFPSPTSTANNTDDNDQNSSSASSSPTTSKIRSIPQSLTTKKSQVITLQDDLKSINEEMNEIVLEGQLAQKIRQSSQQLANCENIENENVEIDTVDVNEVKLSTKSQEHEQQILENVNDGKTLKQTSHVTNDTTTTTIGSIPSDSTPIITVLKSPGQSTSPKLSHKIVSSSISEFGQQVKPQIMKSSDPLSKQDTLGNVESSSLPSSKKVVSSILPSLEEQTSDKATNDQQGKPKQMTLIQEQSIRASKYLPAVLLPPSDVDGLLQEFSEPLRLQEITFDPITMYFTARITAILYIAVDRSPIKIQEFRRTGILTTHYDLGQEIGHHYLHGIMFRLNNLVGGMGSLELVGSPTTWFREVGTGLHDLVVYPYHGIFDGPSGFILGLGSGFSSLVKHVAAGTVNSVTNSAWSISRNLDRITQDEEDRRSEVNGVTDGLGKGLASFGIRMLGAVGGIVHYPIQNVITHGPSTSNILTGVGKGVASIITKPIGGAFELVAMTGEGILKGTGWITANKAKFKPLLDEIETGTNSPLKYHWKLLREEHEERILLIIDASQPEANSVLNPVTLVLTTENLYIFNTLRDELLTQFPLYKLVVVSAQDRNLLCLRTASQRKSHDYSVQEERVIEFVRGFASSNSLAGNTDESEPFRGTGGSLLLEHPGLSENIPGQSTVIGSECIDSSNTRLGDLNDFGDFFVDSSSKIEFINVFNWAKKIINGELFYRAN